MLKTDLNSVREMLLTVTSEATPEASGIIREACRNLESIADQVGCLEAHFIPQDRIPTKEVAPC